MCSYVFTENGSAQLTLKQVDSAAISTAAYSPFIVFNVEDLPMVVSEAVQKGAEMDGSIQFLEGKTTATLRAPDGHMISLVEDLTNSR